MAVSPAEDVIRFGVFELDLKAGQLTRYGTKLRLPQQPLQLLAVLHLHYQSRSAVRGSIGVMRHGPFVRGIIQGRTFATYAVSVSRAELVPGKDLSHFAYVKTTSQRNLYRVSLP